MQIRRIKDRNDNLVAIVEHEFSGIEELQRNLKPGHIAVLWGVTAGEEFISYGRRRKSSSFRYVASSHGYSIKNLVERSGVLYDRDRYRVDRFLSKEIPYWSQGEIKNKGKIYKNIFDFVCNCSWDDIVQYLLENYIDTRRIKAGAEFEFLAYIKQIEKSVLNGNLVINLASGWRYEDILVIARWALTNEIGCLVVVSYQQNSRWLDSELVSEKREGSYVDARSLMRCVQGFYDLTDQTTQAAFRIWRKSLSIQDQKLVNSGKFSRALASRFAEALNETDFQADGGSEGQIPGQRPAPLRFRSENGALDILAAREHSPDEGRVKGGARTCRSAIDDLRDYAGFANAIPNFSKRLTRITVGFDEVLDGSYDDALIVQIGTEVAALEARIWASKEQLGEMAFNEASAFFATVYGFLVQFHSWTDYRVSLSAIPIDKDDQAYRIAKEVLNDVAATPDAATMTAVNRISDFIGGLDNGGGGAVIQKEGAILSAENAASQGAAQIVELAKKEGATLGLEFREQLRVKVAGGLAGWFITNLPRLRVLANSKNLEWLLSFIDHLGN